MTLVALWIRKQSTLSELVAVSDSRLSGGESWDRCPKMVPLPRPATAILMSGDATTAYAFLLQAIHTCLLLDGNEAGRTDIRYLAKKLRAAYAESRRDVSDLPCGQSRPDTPVVNIVLAGWSWRRLRFEAYSYKYGRDGELHMTEVDHIQEKASGVFFAGDARDQASAALAELRRAGGAPRVTGERSNSKRQARTNLDWEPLEVLLDLVKDPKVRTVGGAPQILRIYQYGLVEQFVWRDESGDYFGGRQIKFGERFDRRIAGLVNGKVVLRHSDRSVG